MRILIIIFTFFTFSAAFSQDMVLYRAELNSDGRIIEVLDQPNGRVYFKLPDGQEVYVIFEKDNWAKIETRRHTKGWIPRRFLKRLPASYRFTEELFAMKVKKVESLPKRPAVQIGGRVSYNASSLRNDDHLRNRTTISGGLTLQLNFNDKTALQLEALYKPLGAHGKMKSVDLEDANFKLNYIAMPLTLKNSAKLLGGNVYSELGGSVLYLLDNEVTLNREQVDVDESVFNKIDYGVMLGMGICKKQYHFGLRFYYGLNNVFDKSDFPETKNLYMTLNFGYFLLNL